MITHKNHFNICLALTFSVVLTACSSESDSSDDSNVSSSAPAAPVNLTASVSGDSVSLSWDAVSVASSYKVYRDGGLLSSVVGTSFNESGLADGTYVYEVASVNDYGESASKASVSVDINVDTSSAPVAPTDLTASTDGDSVSLSWSAVSLASSYNVYRDGELLTSVSDTSFSESGLADGTYIYEVASVNDYGESASKASVSVNINVDTSSAPAAPADLTASVDGDSVSLTWSAASLASSYKVYRDGELLNSVSDTSFSESGLTDGTYIYEVASVNDYGESARKASVRVDINADTLSAPTAPTDLIASTDGDSVSLSWSAVSLASSYNVYRDGELLNSVSDTSFSESGLADSTYIYEVASVNDYGESASKASISVDINVDTSSAPAAPADLTASTDGDSVSLSWSAVSLANSYKVYRDGELLNSVSDTSFSESGLADSTYIYEVASVNDYGESASKASISVDINLDTSSTPTAPTDLTASTDGDSVSLSWSAVSLASSYKVYRDGEFLNSVSDTGFSESGLDDGTYIYEVASVNDYGESANKASVSVDINVDNSSAPAAPTDLTASTDGDSVSLSWSAVSLASSYKVYRDGEFVDSVSDTGFSESGLDDGTYIYEVASVNDYGESADKASISVDVETPVAPAAPTDLTASVDGNSVNLTWSAVNLASSYKVYRNGVFRASVNDTSFSDSGLAENTYVYEVSSVNDYGESADKASVSVDVDLSLLLPATPTDLTASVDGDSISLTWSAASRANHYWVIKNGSIVSTSSDTSFNDHFLEHGTYTYIVYSYNDYGFSRDGASITIMLSSEPLFVHQWHLQNTGQDAFASGSGIGGEDINYSGASDLNFTGDGVRVNVIDTGLELQHPDLQANIVAGGSYDYLDGDTDPTNNADAGGDHGTSVAGLIAAVGDNGIGVAGVAGDALLQGYNYLVADPQTLEGYVLAHGQADNLEDTDIFNKSLGTTLAYDTIINSDLLDTLSCLTTGGSFDMSLDASCTSALRSGLGAIYVKAAGNSFATSDGDESCDAFGITCWNANMEPEQTYPYQIVVGALNANGEKSSYSTAGSSVWVSAPGGEYGWDYNYLDSEGKKYGLSYTPPDANHATWQPAMVTVDQVGCDRGYTTARVDTGVSEVPLIGVTSFHEDDDLNRNCEYTSIFNGTSSAAPVVSGVVALMLEANSSLSWRDVKHILAQSARQVDSDAAALDVAAVVCANSSCSSYESSSSISFTARDAWITNAAGSQYHNWYGFGAVNAGAAVAMAQNYSSSLGAWQKSSHSETVSVSIPDATGVAAVTSFIVGDNLTIEAVQLDLSITHTYTTDLAVVLYSPEGTRSVLLTPYNQYVDEDFASTLLSNTFYGESSSGEWRLEIYDLWEGDTGTLTSATISIYGH